jgi:hypothetical protein
MIEDAKVILAVVLISGEGCYRKAPSKPRKLYWKLDS